MNNTEWKFEVSWSFEPEHAMDSSFLWISWGRDREKDLEKWLFEVARGSFFDEKLPMSDDGSFKVFLESEIPVEIRNQNFELIYLVVGFVID